MTTRAELSLAAGNVAEWPSPAVVRRRARRGLRPIEAALAARYRTQFSGSVLQLGSRGDSLTELLAHHAAHLTGMAYSAPEVDLCRSRYGLACFEKQNFIDLQMLEPESFDAVVAGRGALDRLGEKERSRVLESIARLLSDDGVLVLSTHNLARESAVRSPLADAVARPWRLPFIGRALRNRARLGRLQQRSHGFAILNDDREAYGLLTYHVSIEHQERQLRRSGLNLLECLDRSDRPVFSGISSGAERELHFVAQPNR